MSADDDGIGTDEKTDVEDEALASLRAGLEATPKATRRFVLGTLLAAGPIVLTARPAWAQAVSVPDCEIVICLDRKRCERDDDDDDDDDDDEDRHRNQTGRGHDEHGRGYGYGHHKDRDDDDDDCDDDDDDDDRHRNRRGRGHDEHGQGYGYGHHKDDDDDDDDDCDETVVVNARNYIDFAADGRFDEPIYPTSQTGPYVSPQEAARIRKAIRRLARGRARVIASTSCWTSAMDFLTQNRRRH